MSKAREPVVSAQVLLRSASGRRLRGDDAITSQNIGLYLPSSEDAAAVRDDFQSAGFEVGDLVGISFSATAPVSTFEKFFGTKLRLHPDGSVEVAKGGAELPLKVLPKALADRLEAVTFTPPADLYGSKSGLMV